MARQQPTSVTYTQRLKEYMARKGYKHIAMEMLSPMGATADATELYTRFVRDKEYEQLKSRGWFVIHGEVGDILLDRGVEFDDTIELGLRSFFGAKDITCKGIYAFRL